MNKQINKLKNVLDIYLPDSILKDIIIVFKDKNNLNWDKENVSYVFKEPKECPFIKDFYYIPGYSRYVINKEGILKTVRNNFVKKWVKQKHTDGKNIKGGYLVSWAITDSGKKSNISRHRAICLAFKPIKEHPSNFQVNHKDGIPGNDLENNLEWCTPSQNVKHAYINGLFKNKMVRIDAVNWITLENKSFNSIQNCSDYINISHSTITSRLTRDNGIKYEDGWRVKRSTETWSKLKDYIGQSNTHVTVLARNVFNNTVYIFNTVNDAASETNNIYGSVKQQCIDKPATPLNGWNFRYVKDFEGWPKYTEKHLAIFKDKPFLPSNGIEVYDLETNEEMFFTTLNKCSEYFNLSPITISKMARENVTRKNRYVFKLFKIRNVEYCPSIQ